MIPGIRRAVLAQRVAVLAALAGGCQGAPDAIATDGAPADAEVADADVADAPPPDGTPPPDAWSGGTPPGYFRPRSPAPPPPRYTPIFFFSSASA
jgi:hypothetical protein